MNLQQLKYILAVNELQSFSKAAMQCFISQSTLSTMIAKFEDEIGIEIFNRKSKPITTSVEGKVIIDQLVNITKEFDRLYEIKNELNQDFKGHLKIGAIPTIAPFIFPRFLQDFISKFPEVKFEISEIETERIIERVINRSLDVGIVSIPLKNPEVVEIPLYYESFLLYNKSKTNLNNNFRISEIDFNNLWLLEEGHCMRTQMEKICEFRQKRKISSNLEYKCGSIDSLIKFVKKNKGITLIPELATWDLTKNEQNFLRTFKAPIPVRSVGLIINKNFVKKRILKKLQQHIVSKIKPLLNNSGDLVKVFNPV